MKHSIGLIAPQEPETLALLTQQRSIWQQARRQAVRHLLGGRPAGEVVDELRSRCGVWPGLAVRLVRQAQSLLYPGSPARRQYLDYLAGCDEYAGDEVAFYAELPGPGDDALVAVDYRSPEWVSDEAGGLSLLYVPDLKAFYLSLPIANPEGGISRIEGLPVFFADAEAAELRALTKGGNASGRPVVVPSQELIWWQGTPHLVVGFDPDDCVTAYEAIRQPARTGLVTAAVAASFAVQSALPVVGVAMAAESPRTVQVAAIQTPVVKVLDSATGRQLTGVRLVAEDGKVLARSDGSGTLVLPSNYARYNLFNLVKEGYQFMLLESTQLTPHNLLRVEMAPVSAKGKATTRTAAAITPPPALPHETKPQTVSQSVHAATPKPPSVLRSATTQTVKSPVRQAVKPTAHSEAHKPFQTANRTEPKAPAHKPQPPVKVATAPQTAKAPASHTTPAKPQAEQHAHGALPMTKPVLAPRHTKPHQAPQQAAPQAPAHKPHQAEPHQAPQTHKAKPQLPKTSKPSRMAAPMQELAQTPRTPQPAGTYRVKRGDTLWTIAQSQLGSGHRWMAIFALNKGTVDNPAHIHIGQVLQLPQRQAMAAASRVRITVRPGDSLSLIAQKRLGRTDRWREIFEMNRATLRNPRWIFPGQTLWIPAR